MTKTAKNQKSLSIVPTGDRLLIRRTAADVERVTKGGILLPDTVPESNLVGTVIAEVVAIGPGRLLDTGQLGRSVDCKPGERVVIDSAYNAWWIDDPDRPGAKLQFINGADVLGHVQ